MSATNIKKTWFSSNIKEIPSCVCRQYCWENFQANQTSSRSHALLMVSPQTNSSDIKDKYWAGINIYVEPIWYIEIPRPVYGWPKRNSLDRKDKYWAGINIEPIWYIEISNMDRCNYGAYKFINSQTTTLDPANQRTYFAIIGFKAEFL